MKKLIASIFLLFQFTGYSYGADIKEFLLPDHGSFMLPVPKNWTDEIRQPSGNLPPTIIFSQSSGERFVVQITPFWKMLTSPKNYGTSKDLQTRVKVMANRLSPGSVEKLIEVISMGESSRGFYFSATDKASKPDDPDDYKCITQGALNVGNLVAIFTILTNNKDSDIVRLSLDMLQKAKHNIKVVSRKLGSADTIQINELKESYILTVPVSQLIMTIPKGGLLQLNNPTGYSHARYFYFHDKARDLLVTGWFERALKFQGIKKFWEDETKVWNRQAALKPRHKATWEPRDVSFEDIGKWDAVIYDIRLPNFTTTTNSHIRAHWLQAGTWIDIHISITSNQSSVDSRAKLRALLKRIQVKEKKSR